MKVSTKVSLIEGFVEGFNEGFDSEGFIEGFDELYEGFFKLHWEAKPSKSKTKWLKTTMLDLWKETVDNSEWAEREEFNPVDPTHRSVMLARARYYHDKCKWYDVDADDQEEVSGAQLGFWRV